MHRRIKVLGSGFCTANPAIAPPFSVRPSCTIGGRAAHTTPGAPNARAHASHSTDHTRAHAHNAAAGVHRTPSAPHEPHGKVLDGPQIPERQAPADKAPSYRHRRCGLCGCEALLKGWRKATSNGSSGRPVRQSSRTAACALTENGCWARGATRAGMCHKAGRPSPTNGHLRCGGALPSMEFSLSPCLGVSFLPLVGGIHDPCGASFPGCHL